MTADRVQMPAQPPMPSGFQPQPAGTGVPGLGTSGFNPSLRPNRSAPPHNHSSSCYTITSASGSGRPGRGAALQSLASKYNAEVPRLHQEKKTLTEQNFALQNQLQATQALLAGLAQPPALAQPSPQPSLVTDRK